MKKHLICKCIYILLSQVEFLFVVSVCKNIREVYIYIYMIPIIYIYMTCLQYSYIQRPQIHKWDFDLRPQMITFHLGSHKDMCSSRLVVEKKPSRELPKLERWGFTEKVSAEKLFTIRYRRQYLICNLPKVAGTKFLGSDGLHYFISISKFCRFKNSFAMINRLCNLSFKNVTSGSSDEWDLN